jgi:hypothetical protein
LLTRVASEQPDLIEGSLALDWAGSSTLLHQISSEFARAVRYRHPLSLVVVGIDGAEALTRHGALA